MDQGQQSPLRLRELFNAVCDEIATAEQLRDLEDILRSDERARQLYMDYCRLHMRLRFVARVEKMAARAVSAISVSAIIEPKAPAVGPMDVSAPGSPATSPVLGFLGGVMDYVNHSRTMMFWMVTLVVGGWFVVQLGSLMVGRSHPGGAQVAGQTADPNSSDVSHPPGDPFAPLAPRQDDFVAAATVARMSALLDCHWRAVPPAVPPASAPAPGDVDTSANAGKLFHIGSELSSGQQLDLVHGLAEITFRSGAKIVLNGPAHFTVGSKLGGTLQAGKLTAHVPHDARGFTIDGPSGKVVDLGTEFGVAVAADRTMEVEVFVGEVSVTSSAVGSTLGTSERLAAGHAARVVAGQPVASIPLDPKRFVRGLGPREDSRVAHAAYLDWMRSLKPSVWFRMEGKGTERVLHDEMGAAPDGAVHWDGPGNPFVEGRLGKGLWLRGPRLGDYAFVSRYPQAEHGKLSVSAWAYADSRPGWAKFVANWGEEPSGQFSFGLGSEGSDIAVEFKQGDGKQMFLREGVSHPFPFNEWQHVAFVTDGSTMRLYRQGREVASIQHVGLQYPVGLKSLAIGAYQGKNGEEVSKGAPSLWDGRLDEIAIFNDALSADDIRKLAAAPP